MQDLGNTLPPEVSVFAKQAAKQGNDFLNQLVGMAEKQQVCNCASLAPQIPDS